MLAKLYHYGFVLDFAKCISNLDHFSGVCDLEYYYHFAMFNICLKRNLDGHKVHSPGANCSAGAEVNMVLSLPQTLLVCGLPGMR